jgi:hypothetical protein
MHSTAPIARARELQASQRALVAASLLACPERDAKPDRRQAD